MSKAIIRAGFATRLKAWADAQTPVIPVAWPNMVFDPPAGRYIRADLLPAPTGKLFFDGSGRKWSGIVQAVFYMPLGTGAGSVESLAASLDAYFTDSFTQSGVRIYLLSPFSEAAPLPNPSRYVVPVSAEYRADTL